MPKYSIEQGGLAPEKLVISAHLEAIEGGEAVVHTMGLSSYTYLIGDI